MSYAHPSPIATYRNNRLDGALENADPHRLVALLLAGARERLNRVLIYLHNHDIAHKGQAISEVSAIIGHLDSSLDHAAGGAIATSLDTLYSYMQIQLLQANLHNDPQPIKQCLRLLGEIESAWNAIPAEYRHMQPRIPA